MTRLCEENSNVLGTIIGVSILRIAKTTLHKLPGKSSLNARSVCPGFPGFPVCPDEHDDHDGHDYNDNHNHDD